jgi:hypothetical protein
MDVAEMRFFRHPNHARDFVRIIGRGLFTWEREVQERTAEFIRYTLALSEAETRRLTAIEAYQISKQQERPAIVEVKPGFAGVSLNLVELIATISRWLGRRFNR